MGQDIWSESSTQRSRYNPANSRSIPIQFVTTPMDIYNVIDDNRVHQNYEDLESEYYEKLPDVVPKTQFSANTTNTSSLASPPLPPIVNQSTLQRLYYPDGKRSNFHCTRRLKLTACLLCLSAITIALISAFLWQLNVRNIQSSDEELVDERQLYDLQVQKLHRANGTPKNHTTVQQPQIVNEPLISANNLATLLVTKRKLCIFEVSTNEVDQSRSDFEKEHITSARMLFFGIPVHPLQYQRYIRNLGVDSDCKVVLYDKGQVVWSSYAYWIFKLFGHDRVSLLNGGFVEWKERAKDQSNLYKISEGAETPVERLGNFRASWTNNVIVTFDDVLANFESNNPQRYDIIDAQSEEEFEGQAEGAVYGHISGAINIPIDGVYDWHNNTWPQTRETLSLLKSKHVNTTKPIIVYDGTSLRSSLIWFALQRLNIESSIYFASWPEWLVRAPDSLKIIPMDLIGNSNS